MASRERLDSNGPRTKSEDKERVIKVVQSEQRVAIPPGIVPKMPAEDSKVDWVMIEIDFIGYLGRFEGYVDVLLEEKATNDDDVKMQLSKVLKTKNVVYALLQDLCQNNETARLQIRNHWQADVDRWPNTLWNMLKTRFTAERSNNLSF